LIELNILYTLEHVSWNCYFNFVNKKDHCLMQQK